MPLAALLQLQDVTGRCVDHHVHHNLLITDSCYSYHGHDRNQGLKGNPGPHESNRHIEKKSHLTSKTHDIMPKCSDACQFL